MTDPKTREPEKIALLSASVQVFAESLLNHTVPQWVFNKMVKDLQRIDFSQNHTHLQRALYNHEQFPMLAAALSTATTESLGRIDIEVCSPGRIAEYFRTSSARLGRINYYLSIASGASDISRLTAKRCLVQDEITDVLEYIQERSKHPSDSVSPETVAKCLNAGNWQQVPLYIREALELAVENGDETASSIIDMLKSMRQLEPDRLAESYSEGNPSFDFSKKEWEDEREYLEQYAAVHGIQGLIEKGFVHDDSSTREDNWDY